VVVCWGGPFFFFFFFFCRSLWQVLTFAMLNPEDAANMGVQKQSPRSIMGGCIRKVMIEGHALAFFPLA